MKANKKESKYFSLTECVNKNTQCAMIFGERDSGKTYAHKKFNYFKKSPEKKATTRGTRVDYGGVTFVCDNPAQAELLKRWLKAGGQF